MTHALTKTERPVSSEDRAETDGQTGGRYSGRLLITYNWCLLLICFRVSRWSSLRQSVQLPQRWQTLSQLPTDRWKILR